MSEVRILTQSDKNQYDKVANHIIQSWEWGEFRQNEGKKVVRIGEFKDKKLISVCQITFHKIPKTNFSIGYAPKTKELSGQFLDFLKVQATKEKAVFIKFEPDLIEVPKSFSNLKKSSKTIFAPNTFLLDLTKNDQDLLSNMHQKTRYNIRLSEKKGVKAEIDNSQKAYSEYLKLTKITTKRQKFYAHDEKYHKLLWEGLRTSTIEQSNNRTINLNKLQAHLLKASYKNKTLVTYILFTFKDTLYYPYGASSDEYREVMASHGAMWEAIKFGKNLGFRKFDMWGAANTPDPKPSDPYFGFHRFKQGFGATLTEFIGSYDLVINPLNYRLLTVADKIRWAYLKAKKTK